MKVLSLSAVLCLAASALAAVPQSQGASTHSSNLADNGAVHNGLSAVSTPENVNRRPVGLMRHEWMEHHKEHGLEAHRDGKGKPSSSDDDDKKEKNGDDSSSDDEDSKGKKKSGDSGDDDGGDKKGSSEDSKGDESGDSDESKKGDSGSSSKDSDGSKKGDSGKKNGPGSGKKNGPGKSKGSTDPSKGDKGKGGGAPKDQSPAKGGKPVPAAPATPGTPEKGTTPPPTDSTAAPPEDSSSDITSPIWVVQPFGASIWEQGVEYVISWGPNPDASYAKNLAPKTPIKIHLMKTQVELQLLASGVDSSVNMFKWKVPTTLAPAKDYSIRLMAEGGKLETYSHYFEVSPAGDKRSTKSNVGEPLEKPQMGDVSLPLGSKIAPAPPPNPVPDVKKEPAAAVPPATDKPQAKAKPAAHSDGSEVKSNMLAFALALFGAVYFL
ncbi:hypothetical protein BGZ73_007156 [Actinomortierella ambigua]|nr:hypothetical protein BGZ73_007156 [Actinomortierella ambigua]